MATALDFSAGFPSPEAVKAAGHVGVIAYVAPARPDAQWMKAKPLTREAADRYRAAGIEISSNHQYGKPGSATGSDWRGGFEAGARMARQALDIHFAAGGPGYCPIYFSIDEDITLKQWNDTAVQWFRGINSVIGKEWTGIYGGSKQCAWAVEDDVVGRSTTPGKFWVWQTKAWSQGIVPEAVIYQRIVDTASSPGPVIGGITCDVNDILAEDWGQWSIDRSPKTEQKKESTVAYNEIDRMGNSRSNRFGAKVVNFLLHTEEGNATAEGLAAYCNNSGNGVSYHYTLRDGALVAVVDTDYASWSVLDWNNRTINLCFAGSRAGWTRDQWLARRDDLRVAAWVAVRDCRKYGIPCDIIAPPYRAVNGISDHRYVTWRGVGTHTDVGVNFPWDVFAQFVIEFAAGNQAVAAAPVRNEIDAEYERAKAWIGKRLTGELVIGDGRLSHFENGSIYWHPRVGAAHAIPARLMEAYGDYGWENGPLGYPVNDHSVLVDGDVQAFENAVLYRKYDQPLGFYVGGYILAAWRQVGWEQGIFGWPTSLESDVEGGGRVQSFEHGRIVWNPDGGTVGLFPEDGDDRVIRLVH